MSIKTRIVRLEQTVSKNDENVIWVKIINDDGTVGHCGSRKDDCPEYPCVISETDSCWMKKKYPDMETIKIEGSENDG